MSSTFLDNIINGMTSTWNSMHSNCTKRKLDNDVWFHSLEPQSKKPKLDKHGKPCKSVEWETNEKLVSYQYFDIVPGERVNVFRTAYFSQSDSENVDLAIPHETALSENKSFDFIEPDTILDNSVNDDTDKKEITNLLSNKVQLTPDTLENKSHDQACDENKKDQPLVVSPSLNTNLYPPLFPAWFYKCVKPPNMTCHVNDSVTTILPKTDIMKGVELRKTSSISPPETPKKKNNDSKNNLFQRRLAAKVKKMGLF